MMSPPGTEDPAPRRLLIVEDEADVAESLCALLAHPLIAIERAANGVEALARAREMGPHAILLDLWLPVMDGFQVFRILRRDEELENTRVIFVSAFAPAGAFALAQDLGAYASLKKPFSERSLRRTVFAALDLDASEPNPLFDIDNVPESS